MTSREEEGDRGGNESEFDTNLPTAHSYLGYMDYLQGYTLYDEGSEVELLGFHADTWVCPGHTLPLYVDYHTEVEIMRQYMTTCKTFVLICSKSDESQGYGITMEIIEASEPENILALKAKGRQRCKIIKTKLNMTHRMEKLVVKILPDIELSSPLFNCQLPSLNKRRAAIVDNISIHKNKKLRAYDCAQLRFPLWVYDQNEPLFLTEKIQKLLKRYSIDNAPTDPMKLSYWFMQNFQLNNDERLEILKLNSAVQRLKLELHYLQMKRLLCCSYCGTVIAKQSDVFAMSKDGLQTNYCNPGGYVYETLTVSDACHITLVGIASEQFSWFPGYAWTIAQCSQCNHHLGWLFTSKKIKPRRFWGLAKNCINAKIVNCQKLYSTEKEDAVV